MEVNDKKILLGLNRIDSYLFCATKAALEPRDLKELRSAVKKIISSAQVLDEYLSEVQDNIDEAKRSNLKNQSDLPDDVWPGQS